ncbi:MAG: SIMPL domain-containing protein [Candidatus Falkowbacteria bacterium]|nr:SIMPL domain-containing protein [Candidatus Falkowbacteria bacterium]
MKKSQVFLAVLLILAVTAIVICALRFNGQQKNEDRFSVSGSGIIYAKADIANIQLGFKTETKKTAAEATIESSAKMGDIIKAIKALGVDEKDIQTNSYNLNPVYNYTNIKGQELAGYEVYQNLSIKVRDLTKIGEIIAKGTEKGANQIGGISFTIDDEFALKNQARELAIGKAKEKAALIAKQSGMKLGEVKSVSENSNEGGIIPMYANAKMDLAIGSGATPIASPEIATGQNEIKVDVTLTYEVK